MTTDRQTARSEIVCLDKETLRQALTLVGKALGLPTLGALVYTAYDDLEAARKRGQRTGEEIGYYRGFEDAKDYDDVERLPYDTGKEPEDPSLAHAAFAFDKHLEMPKRFYEGDSGDEDRK